MPEGFREIERSVVSSSGAKLTRDFELQTDASAVGLGAVSNRTDM